MSEWMTKKLGEVAEIAIGGTPSRSIPSYWASETNTGYPWVSIGDLGPRRIYETKEEITDDGVRFSNVKKVEGGTVIMSFKLTIGKTAIAGCDLFTNEAIVAVRPFANVLSNRLLYYILPEAAGRTVTESAIKGATLNKKKLFDIPLSFPADISEQEDIARILSSADEQIGKTETLIAKYQQIKAGLMHSLFTRGLEANGALRPMQEDKPDIYQLINGFTAPREWRILKCADLCSRICVGIVIKPAQYYVVDGISALRSANVREAGVCLDDMVYISSSANSLLGKSQIRTGDILTVRTGYPGTSAVVPPSLNGCNCIDVIISTPTAEIDTDYLCYWINSSFGKDQVLMGQGGLAQQHFNVREMRDLIVVVPPKEEQLTIVARLKSHEALIQFEMDNRDKLSSIKSGLSRDLLSGNQPCSLSRFKHE